MIKFVTLDNVHRFHDNPLVAQHRLRYKSIILRQRWNVPHYHEKEFDEYDNPASKYLVYMGENGVAYGVSRLYPTTLPYMLEEKFSNFMTARKGPVCDERIWEGSRFCIEDSLPKEIRQRIIQEIVVGYLETALKFNVRAIIGLMHPVYWKNVFINSGWRMDFMGEALKLEDGSKARAGWLPCTEEMLLNVRRVTGIQENIVNFGVANEERAASQDRKAA